MRLSELNAQFVGAGGAGITDAKGDPVPERFGVGVLLDCPCGCDRGLYVPFANPLDGLAPVNAAAPKWQRTGDTLETLTLRPSILLSDPYGCRWHGFITDGKTSTC